MFKISDKSDKIQVHALEQFL